MEIIMGIAQTHINQKKQGNVIQANLKNGFELNKWWTKSLLVCRA